MVTLLTFGIIEYAVQFNLTVVPTSIICISGASIITTIVGGSSVVECSVVVEVDVIPPEIEIH